MSAISRRSFLAASVVALPMVATLSGVQLRSSRLRSDRAAAGVLRVTGGTLVARALRIIGVIAGSEVPSQEETALGLEALNGLVDMWRIEQLHIRQVDPSCDVVMFDATAVVTMRRAHARAVVFNLARELAPDFGVTPTPDLLRLAAESRESLI